MASRQVVVAGGSGFVGKALTRVLQSRSYNVTWITRQKDIRVPNEVSILTWDQINKEGLPKCEAVCNVTGQRIDSNERWTAKLKEKVRSSRIQTSQTLTQAIIATPEEKRPKTYIGISGVGYYPIVDGKHFDEQSEGGDGFFEHLCRDLENASLPLSNSTKTRRVILRSGAVLGRDGGAFQSMYWPFYFGVGGPFGSGKQAFPNIHIYDLAHLFVHAIEIQTVQGILNAVTPETITNKEFCNELGKQMHRPSFLPLPSSVLELIFSKERAALLLKGSFIHPKRTLESGFKYRFPTVKSTIQDLLS